MQRVRQTSKKYVERHRVRIGPLRVDGTMGSPLSRATSCSVVSPGNCRRNALNDTARSDSLIANMTRSRSVGVI